MILNQLNGSTSTICSHSNAGCWVWVLPGQLGPGWNSLHCAMFRLYSETCEAGKRHELTKHLIPAVQTRITCLWSFHHISSTLSSVPHLGQLSGERNWDLQVLVRKAHKRKQKFKKSEVLLALLIGLHRPQVRYSLQWQIVLKVGNYWYIYVYVYIIHLVFVQTIVNAYIYIYMFFHVMVFEGPRCFVKRAAHALITRPGLGQEALRVVAGRALSSKFFMAHPPLPPFTWVESHNPKINTRNICCLWRSNTAWSFSTS